MPIPKLFLYKAAEANVVVILRRGEKRETWEMIRWDLDTDTFTEGQWLMKKSMNAKYCHLSPCGRYFAYHYDIYSYVKGEQNWECHGVISAVPNFTALYFNANHVGNYETLAFTEKGEVLSSGPMVKKGMVDLPFYSMPGHSLKPQPLPYADKSYISTAEWTDVRGRVITTEGGKLLADGTLLYDTTSHAFAAKSPF